MSQAYKILRCVRRVSMFFLVAIAVCQVSEAGVVIKHFAGTGSNVTYDLFDSSSESLTSISFDLELAGDTESAGSNIPAAHFHHWSMTIGSLPLPFLVGGSTTITNGGAIHHHRYFTTNGELTLTGAHVDSFQSVGGGTGSFSLVDIQTEVTGFHQHVILASQAQWDLTVTYVSVPEPASISLVFISIATICCFGGRRRRCVRQESDPLAFGTRRRRPFMRVPT